MNKQVVITGERIPLSRMYALRGALKLEIQGMSRRGRSAYAIIKSEFKLKGTRKKVLDLFGKLITEHEERVSIFRDNPA